MNRVRWVTILYRKLTRLWFIFKLDNRLCCFQVKYMGSFVVVGSNHMIWLSANEVNTGGNSWVYNTNKLIAVNV